MWWFLASIALGLIVKWTAKKPKVEKQRPGGLGDFNITTATEGRPVPVIFGRVRIKAPNVLWYGNLTTEDVGNGNYRYSLGIQWGLCRGQVDHLITVWNGDRIVWNGTRSYGDGDLFINKNDDFFKQNVPSDFAIRGLLGFRFGRPDEVKDSYLDTQQPYAVPYDGTCYAVWKGTDAFVESGAVPNGVGGFVGFGTSIDEWNFEVERYGNALGVFNEHHRVDNGMNPACVYYELLTSDEWGIGERRTSIDVPNFRLAAETYYSEHNSFRFVWDSESTVRQMVDELNRQTDSKLYFDKDAGVWRIKLFRKDYDPATIPVVDNTMIVSIDNKSDGSWEDTYNVVRVEYLEPTKNYETGYALSQSGANQAIVGRISPTTVRYPGCMSAALANALAWRDGRQASFPPSRFEYTCNRNLHSLKFGDVCRIVYGSQNFKARVLSVDYGQPSDNRIKLVVSRETFHNEPGTFATPETAYWTESGTELIPLANDDQAATDAPYALAKSRVYPTRPDVLTGVYPAILTLARRQYTGNSEAKFYRVFGRYGTTPGGENVDYDFNYKLPGGFSYCMLLKNSLPGYGTSLPAEGASTIRLSPVAGLTLWQQNQQLFLSFPSISDAEINENLMGLAVIEPGTANEEFIICRKVGIVYVSGAGTVDMDMENVYRGCLDTAVKPHAAGARVWFLFAKILQNGQFVPAPLYGAGIVPHPSTLPDDDYYYKLKYQPSGPNAWVNLDDCNELNELTVSDPKRCVLPILPREVKINNVRYPSTVNTHYNTGSGVEGLRFFFLRCQWRNVKPLSQLRGLEENGTYFSDMSVDSVGYTVRIYDLAVHPSPVRGQEFFTVTSNGDSNNDFVIPRTILLAAAGGVMPTNVRIEINARHTVAENGAAALESRDSIFLNVTLT